ALGIGRQVRAERGHDRREHAGDTRDVGHGCRLLSAGEANACPNRIQDCGDVKPFAKGPDNRVRSGPPLMRLQGFPGAALVAGAGLFLAMTALLAASRAPEDTPSFRLHVAVPDPLLLASGAAFTLAVAIVIGIALSRDRRREEVEREEEPSKLPWWLQAILRALPLLPLLAILVAFSFGWQYVESSLLAWSRFVMFAGSDAGAPQPELPVLSLPWLGWLLGLLL